MKRKACNEHLLPFNYKKSNHQSSIRARRGE
ncbi:hypothetical protein ACUXCC_004746 [Cytobacillus horneckiae]